VNAGKQVLAAMMEADRVALCAELRHFRPVPGCFDGLEPLRIKALRQFFGEVV